MACESEAQVMCLLTNMTKRNDMGIIFPKECWAGGQQTCVTLGILLTSLSFCFLICKRWKEGEKKN